MECNVCVLSVNKFPFNRHLQGNGDERVSSISICVQVSHLATETSDRVYAGTL